jgi:hypothetical protein
MYKDNEVVACFSDEDDVSGNQNNKRAFVFITAFFDKEKCEDTKSLIRSKRFALFDLLKSLYSDAKILSKYIPSLQKRL